MKKDFRTVKVAFDRLIGTFNLELNMVVLDWMLKTGRDHQENVGRWQRDGINKLLFGYSANNHNFVCAIPNEPSSIDMFFDAVFARAIYAKAGEYATNWRYKNRILPGKYRMFKLPNHILPIDETIGIYGLISKIYALNGRFLKKEHAQPERIDRIYPKIIDINIFTLGNGWIVQYDYSFSNINYEGGWAHGFSQDATYSVLNFLQEALFQINTHCEPVSKEGGKV